ncbi:MAG: hypothetical protein ACREQQ_02515, partial [Candidatus Binatia bacterium]
MTTNQRGRLEISGGGIVLLGVTTLVATGIVFLLGIYVGKGMIEQRLQQESRVFRLTVPTPGAGKQNEGDVTFWDKLGKGGEPTPPPAAPPTPTTAPSSVRIAPPTRAAEPREADRREAGPPTQPPARAAAAEGGSYQVQVNAMADKVRAEQLV